MDIRGASLGLTQPLSWWVVFLHPQPQDCPGKGAREPKGQMAGRPKVLVTAALDSSVCVDKKMCPSSVTQGLFISPNISWPPAVYQMLPVPVGYYR